MSETFKGFLLCLGFFLMVFGAAFILRNLDDKRGGTVKGLMFSLVTFVSGALIVTYIK